MKQILRLYKVLMCWDLPRPEVERNLSLQEIQGYFDTHGAIRGVFQ